MVLTATMWCFLFKVGPLWKVHQYVVSIAGIVMFIAIVQRCKDDIFSSGVGSDQIQTFSPSVGRAVIGDRIRVPERPDNSGSVILKAVA